MDSDQPQSLNGRDQRPLFPDSKSRGRRPFKPMRALLSLGLAALAVPVIATLLGSAPTSVSQASALGLPAGNFELEPLLAKFGQATTTEGDTGRLETTLDGYRVSLTLDAALQERADAVFRRYKVPYGALVAVEPATGRILAMAEYSANEPDADGLCLRATYPAASLVKVVTAAAALETGKVSAETLYRYEGSPYKLARRKISPKNKRREHNEATLAQALGQSNNVIFGKVGANLLGPSRLASALDRFEFNRHLPFELDLQPSSATVPDEDYPLARTAAGFGDIYVSPVHAALIAAAVANDGLMMRPYLVEAVTDPAGELVYANAPAPLGRAVEPEIADELSRMMETTIREGTSSKIFNRHARKLVREIDIAGKTGSLTGIDPPGRYDWFIGFAPLENPRIAVAALVVNQGDLWHIKGTYTAAAVMREHFGL